MFAIALENYLVLKDWLTKFFVHLKNCEKKMRRNKLKEMKNLTRSNNFLCFQ